MSKAIRSAQVHNKTSGEQGKLTRVHHAFQAEANARLSCTSVSVQTEGAVLQAPEQAALGRCCASSKAQRGSRQRQGKAQLSRKQPAAAPLPAAPAVCGRWLQAIFSSLFCTLALSDP